MANYETAKARVDGSETLGQYSDIILADWNEGDEHLEWVATADESEIVDWAAGIRADELTQESERGK